VCAYKCTTYEDRFGGSGTPASGQYSWSPCDNTCFEDSMWAPADAPCYKGKSSYDPTAYDSSICLSVSCARDNDTEANSLIGGSKEEKISSVGISS